MKCHPRRLSVVLAPLLALPIGAQTGKAPAKPPDWPIEAKVQAALNDQSVTKTTPPSPAAFNPSVSLASRITIPPDAVLQRFHDPAKPSPTLHELSDAEHARVVEALQQLPAFARQALTEHVRSISFFDGMASNGTTIKEPRSSDAVFNMVIRASILHESVSDFLTRKERNCYTASDSGMTLSVEAGSLPALLYVFLHESVHVLDISNRAGQAGSPTLFVDGASAQLVEGVWDDASTINAAYRSPLLDSICFRTGKPESMDVAEATAQALARTPFVSLYGSSNWYDDVAELIICYYLTQKLHQPYRIVLRKGPDVLYSLAPMSSGLVIARFAAITALFA
jgi:hypothetical protein